MRIDADAAWGRQDGGWVQKGFEAAVNLKTDGVDLHRFKDFKLESPFSQNPPFVRQQRTRWQVRLA